MNSIPSTGRRRLGSLLIATALATLPGSAAMAQDVPPVGASAVQVSGTSTLIGELSLGTLSSAEGVISVRGNVLATIEQSSDPRVAGRAMIVVHFDAYPDAQGRVGATQVRYGSMRLENDDGSWSGRFTGRLIDSGFLQTYWLAGEGGYEGLSYVVTAGGSGQTWQSSGLIYPGDIPPMGPGRAFGIDGPSRDLPVAWYDAQQWPGADALGGPPNAGS